MIIIHSNRIMHMMPRGDKFRFTKNMHYADPNWISKGVPRNDSPTLSQPELLFKAVTNSLKKIPEPILSELRIELGKRYESDQELVKSLSYDDFLAVWLQVRKQPLEDGWPEDLQLRGSNNQTNSYKCSDIGADRIEIFDGSSGGRCLMQEVFCWMHLNCL